MVYDFVRIRIRICTNSYSNLHEFVFEFARIRVRIRTNSSVQYARSSPTWAATLDGTPALPWHTNTKYLTKSARIRTDSYGQDA